MAPIYPSEMKDAPVGAELEVAGRLLRRAGRRLTLVDALAFIEVTLAGEPEGPLDEGDLVVVRGRHLEGALTAARLVRIDYGPRSVGFEPGAEAAHLAPPRAETRRLVDGGVGRSLYARARVIAQVRAFFAARGYLEVETPSLIPSPGLDLHLDAFAVKDAGFLVTSPEYQMKRLLVGGLPRIFQLARCFRRGEHGARHNPEFTMLEWYRAQGTIESLMDETEALVREVLEAFAPGPMPLAGGPVDYRRPFLRMTVAEAFERFAATPRLEMLRLAQCDEERYFRLIVESVEPGLARLGVPVFLHRFPMSQASLARSDPADPTLSERVELYLGDLELSNGFGELTCPLEQRGRLLADQQRRRAEGRSVYPLDERFLAALSEGMPPAAGNALGLDRLVALALGAASVAEVMAFPIEVS